MTAAATKADTLTYQLQPEHACPCAARANWNGAKDQPMPKTLADLIAQPLQFSGCYCIGPQGCDPVCPCQMRLRGQVPANVRRPDREQLLKSLAEMSDALRKRSN